ncbi:MAG: DUF6079 family protein [Chloroflexaceae bacterium]
MTRRPLRDLIVPKAAPDLTPSLVRAFRQQAETMVETYIFTDTIRGYFEQTIFDAVARGQGQGFWVQAEYGAGKTHFLTVLSALLSDTSQALWSRIQDEDIRQAHRRLGGARLFPVVLSLRGEGAGDGTFERSLLDVLLEAGFQPALEAAGLDGQVRITPADDIVAWLEEQASPALRQDAYTFVQGRTEKSVETYRELEGTSALAGLLTEYFKQANIRPNIHVSVKERLAHIYRQLTDPTGPAYTGLLVVIDEYEGWSKGHSSPEEQTRDAEILETLAYLLPRDLGLQVYTVVASQSDIPTKLRGSQGGDRFIPLPLLVQVNERDYDVIIARRVRGIDPERVPEVEQLYDNYRQHFGFCPQPHARRVSGHVPLPAALF